MACPVGVPSQPRPSPSLLMLLASLIAMLAIGPALAMEASSSAASQPASGSTPSASSASSSDGSTEEDPSQALAFAFLTNAAIALVIATAWLLLRPYWSAVFTPNVAEEQNRGIPDPISAPVGFFGWVRPVLTTPLAWYRRRRGLDTYLYMDWVHDCALLFGGLLLYSLIVTMPINSAGTNKSLPENDPFHVSGLDIVSMANIPYGSSLLWAHIVSLLLLTVALVFWAYRRYLHYHVLRKAYLARGDGHPPGTPEYIDATPTRSLFAQRVAVPAAARDMSITAQRALLRDAFADLLMRRLTPESPGDLEAGHGDGPLLKVSPDDVRAVALPRHDPRLEALRRDEQFLVNRLRRVVDRNARRLAHHLGQSHSIDRAEVTPLGEPHGSAMTPAELTAAHLARVQAGLSSGAPRVQHRTGFLGIFGQKVDSESNLRVRLLSVQLAIAKRQARPQCRPLGCAMFVLSSRALADAILDRQNALRVMATSLLTATAGGNTLPSGALTLHFTPAMMERARQRDLRARARAAAAQHALDEALSALRAAGHLDADLRAWLAIDAEDSILDEPDAIEPGADGDVQHAGPPAVTAAGPTPGGLTKGAGSFADPQDTGADIREGIRGYLSPRGVPGGGGFDASLLEMDIAANPDDLAEMAGSLCDPLDASDSDADGLPAGSEAKSPAPRLGSAGTAGSAIELASIRLEPLDQAPGSGTVEQEAPSPPMGPTDARTARTRVTLTGGPDRTDLDWRSLAYGNLALMVRRILSLGVFVFLILFWAIPVAFVQSLGHLRSLSQSSPALAWIGDLLDLLGPNIESLLNNYLPSLLLVILMSLVVPLMSFLIEREAHPTRTRSDRHMFDRFLTFLVINVFLVSTLAGSLLARLEEIFDGDVSLILLLAQSLPSQGMFFIEYCLVKFSFLSLELLQPGYMFLVLFNQIFLGGFNDPKREFLFAARYAWDSLIIVISLVFSLMYPMILCFAFAYFAFSALVHRYNFIYVHRNPAQLGGRLWPRTHRSGAVALALWQLTMLGVFALNGSAGRGPAILTAVIMTLSGLTMWLIPPLTRRLVGLVEARRQETGRRSLSQWALDLPTTMLTHTSLGANAGPRDHTPASPDSASDDAPSVDSVAPHTGLEEGYSERLRRLLERTFRRMFLPPTREQLASPSRPLLDPPSLFAWTHSGPVPGSSSGESSPTADTSLDVVAGLDLAGLRLTMPVEGPAYPAPDRLYYREPIMRPLLATPDARLAAATAAATASATDGAGATDGASGYHDAGQYYD
ncbi:hypothetical protein H696_02283 [Fonticula alba]|uniref:CSC1/OSCA1-like 7TM region domain-containing protein n=1 Tax=Fonticula alba TaxID=691883 RepID=A0A058ZBP0_FONAL|nr:hypothetical protein H696_02283 [Fonticula alba]KCV71338.1 hypothetical protein H696_02283 [Fonticula alba]|eukprot:XP_009494461.1 hypothetical protein H696_02283 [Fonticula alba]